MTTAHELEALTQFYKGCTIPEEPTMLREGILKVDVWPLQVAKPKEKESPPEQIPGVRTKLYKDRGKEKKPPKEPIKRTPYGKRGDKVKIISYSTPVYIVEGKERFTVHENEIEIINTSNDGNKEKRPG